MLRLLAAIGALVAVPADAADLSALCKGWSGNWHVQDDSSKGKDGTWKPDLTNPLWHVEPVSAGKCHFVMSDNRDDDFDVDTSQGSYDVTDYKDGKALPVERYKVLSAAIEDPQSWTVIVAVPRDSEKSRYSRLVMTMAGDFFSIMVDSAASPDAPYFPRAITVHRRVH